MLLTDDTLTNLHGLTEQLLILVLSVPFLRDLFGFATLRLNDLSICLAAGFASILWFDAIKLIRGMWLTQRSRQ